MNNKIEQCLDKFINGNGKNKGRKADERYASFDYCYSYFYSFYKQGKLDELANDENLQTSCLQLGFYLASWGMLRGSSFLLEKSVRNFKQLIIAISKMEPKLWAIDVDDYCEENVELLLSCKKEITLALGKEYRPSDTLVTKIMLGIFANIPAYDQYFKKSMKIGSLSKKSLAKIKSFYDENKAVLDSYKIYTFDFLSGRETNIRYSKAKLIDMCGFVDGQ